MALNIVIIPKKKEKRRLTWLLQAQYRSQINLQLLLIIQSRTLRWAIITEETWAAQTPAPQLCVPYPRCAQRHPAGTVATSSPPRRGECEEPREKHQQKGTSTCPSASPAGTLSAVAIAPDTLNEQYVNDSGCTETRGIIFAFKRKKKERGVGEKS